MNFKQVIYTCLFLCLQYALYADVYFIRFKDKPTTQLLSSPEQYLSPKAIERRQAQSIPIELDDLPVHTPYIDLIRPHVQKIYHVSKWMNGVLVQTDETSIDQISALSIVESIFDFKIDRISTAENTRLSELASTNKTAFFNTQNNTTAHEMLGVDMMHQFGYTGKGVTIAVFDAGFPNVNTIDAFKHLSVPYSYDMIDLQTNVYHSHPHGTEVLSAIAAKSATYKGVAYDADFLLFRTENTTYENPIEEYLWAIAAEKADSAGADIINSSLGYYDFDNSIFNYSYSDLDGNTAITTIAAEKAFKKGIVVVNAAGNSAMSPWGTLLVPSDGEHVIAVGAVDNSEMIASFSSPGRSDFPHKKPDVVALGALAPVIGISGGVIRSNGTSFAAPLITGLLAGLKEAFSEVSAKTLRSMLINSGDRKEHDLQYGYGIPSFPSIYFSYGASDHLKVLETSVFPNPFSGNEVVIFFENQVDDTLVDVTLYRLSGQKVKSYHSEIKAGFVHLDLPEELFPNGIYILHYCIEKDCNKVKIVRMEKVD